LILGLPGERETDVELTIDLVEKLKQFKSLIIPLFLVSEGRLEENAESFSMKKMTLKHSELFLKCWKHNFNWSEVFLREFFLMKKGNKGRGIKILFSYAISHAKRLIRKCEKDYDCDLVAMINDVKSGRANMTPLPVRLIYRLALSRAQKAAL